MATCKYCNGEVVNGICQSCRRKSDVWFDKMKEIKAMEGKDATIIELYRGITDQFFKHVTVYSDNLAYVKVKRFKLSNLREFMEKAGIASPLAPGYSDDTILIEVNDIESNGFHAYLAKDINIGIIYDIKCHVAEVVVSGNKCVNDYRWYDFQRVHERTGAVDAGGVLRAIYLAIAKFLYR